MPRPKPTREQLVTRFMARVQSVPGPPPTPCLLWTGALTKKGYALFHVRPFNTAHVWAYHTFVGPVPEGHELDHLCKRRHCANHGHVEPVPHAVNVARGVRAQKTHCDKGHPLTGDNLKTSRGHRSCRTCQNAYLQQWRKQKSRVRG